MAAGGSPPTPIFSGRPPFLVSSQLRFFRLSKPIQARQLVVTGAAWYVAGYAAAARSAGGNVRTRQVLYEFNPSGEFVREIVLKGPTTEASGGEKQEHFRRQADMSHLFADAAGNLYLVQPSAAPVVFRFNPAGELTGRRELPKLAGTSVTNALLDDHGQLVLERGTVRNPGDRRPQQRVPSGGAELKHVGDRL